MNKAHRRHPEAQLLPIVPDTTDRLGVGRTSVYKLVADGELEAVKIGRRTLVVAESVDAYIAKLRSAA